jgi:ATP-binding cassette subfamily F protein uup
MRLLLARLLLGGCNVILLDEPTNDLDLMTLRILEDALMAFDGASLVISHDRALLDRVCTSVLSFEGQGRVVQYASRLQAQQFLERQREVRTPTVTRAPVKVPPASTRKGLTWKEKKELEALPARIEAMEADQGLIEEQLGDPGTYRESPERVAALTREFETGRVEIEALYARWEALEAREVSNGSGT